MSLTREKAEELLVWAKNNYQLDFDIYDDTDFTYLFYVKKNNKENIIPPKLEEYFYGLKTWDTELVLKGQEANEFLAKLQDIRLQQEKIQAGKNNLTSELETSQIETKMAQLDDKENKNRVLLNLEIPTKQVSSLQREIREETPRVKVVTIPFVHQRINIQDLNSANYKLFSDEQIKAIKIVLNNHKLIASEIGTVSKDINSDQLPDAMRISKKVLRSIGDKYPELACLKDVKFSVEVFKDQNHEVHYCGVYRGKKQETNKSKYHLGEGGFGVTKLLLDLDSSETYALKVNSNLQTSKEDFTTETRALEVAGSLICAYERTGSEKKKYQFIMKLAKGAQLDTEASLQQSMPTIRWLDLCINMANALQELHSKGIIHRDLKPANILYDPAIGKITLIDFGLAARVDDANIGLTGIAVGTLGYIAPESLREGNRGIFNAKSDVYALGKLLSQVLGFASIDKSIDINYMSRKDFNMNRIKFTSASIIRNEKNHGTKINDSTQRLLIYYMLLEMVNENPENRPTMEKVLKYMEELRQWYLDVNSRITQVYYLDVDQYASLDKDAKQALTDHLSESFNEVRLFDTSNHSVIEYIQVKQELERARLCVKSDVVQCTKSNKQEILLEAAAKSERDSDRYIYECHVYDTKYGLYPIKAALDQVQYDKVISSLNNEIIRLTPKKTSSATERALHITHSVGRITKLYGDGELNYKELHSILNELQKKLLSQFESKNFIQKYFDSDSLITHRVIKDQIESLKHAEKPGKY